MILTAVLPYQTESPLEASLHTVPQSVPPRDTQGRQMLGKPTTRRALAA